LGEEKRKRKKKVDPSSDVWMGLKAFNKGAGGYPKQTA